MGGQSSSRSSVCAADGGSNTFKNPTKSPAVVEQCTLLAVRSHLEELYTSPILIDLCLARRGIKYRDM